LIGVSLAHNLSTEIFDGCFRTKNNFSGVFYQHPTDQKRFLTEHELAHIAPFPGFNQITRKDWLWHYYQVQAAPRGGH
jgi:hypothetical protein